MREPEPKAAGTWDFYGACAPAENADGTYGYVGGETFTLGCFQWVPMARGKKVKKGKVQYRVKGISTDPAAAFKAARDFCAKKNAQSASTHTS